MFSKRSGGGLGFGRAFSNKNKKHQKQQQKQQGQQQRGWRSGANAARSDDDSGMMMSSDSSPSLPLATPNYVELPEEPRPGKISPSTNSSGSPRAASKSDNRSSPEADPDETDTIEEAVPIVRSTLPSPEPRPTIERNGGYKNSSMTDDRVDGSATNGLSSNNNNGIKPLPYQQHRDIDEDSCLIKCIYFTQQCCECTIV